MTQVQQPPTTNPDAALQKLLAQAVDGGLAFLRRSDPDAAADPVDTAVATSSFIEFRHSASHGARAYVPGLDNPVPLSYGASATGRPWPAGSPTGCGRRRPRPVARAGHPRRGRAGHRAAVHRRRVVAVHQARARLPREASMRVNFVLFALSRCDAYPGWRTILADNKGQLQAHAPRFGSAPWFPVSARLAETAMSLDGETQAELDPGVADRRPAARARRPGRQGPSVQLANVLRSVRSEMIGLDRSSTSG